MNKKAYKPVLADISTFDNRATKYASYVSKLQQTRFVTGYSIIDEDIRGIGAGELMIIAAYSGTFKSAYLQNMLMNYGKSSGQYALMFSLEMPDSKVFEREMQIANGAYGYQVENGVYNRTDTARGMANMAREHGGNKLLTVDRPKLTLSHVAEYICLAKERYELGVVAVDYLGLLKGDHGRSSADLTEDMSNGAKELSKEVGLPIILLTQINRAAARMQSEEGAEIEMHHLKYGGEAGADIVLGLYRDPEKSLILKVLKNRGGSTGQQYKADISAHALRFNGFEEYVVTKKDKKGKTVPEELPY